MTKLKFILCLFFVSHLACVASDLDVLYDWRNYTSPGVTGIVHDARHIYIATVSGIVAINKQTGEQPLYNRVSGLTDNYIFRVRMIGDELWYGGYRNGFGMIKDGTPYNYSRATAPLYHTAWVTAVEKDRQGILYVSSLSNLCKFVGGQCVGIYPFPHHPMSAHEQIDDIFADDEGTVWVSGYSAAGMRGLGVLTDDGIEMVYEGLGRVTKILKSQDDTMWCLADQGILRYDGSEFTEYRTDEAGHSLADMKDMAVDAQGALWLVNQNKLVRFDGKTATEYISDFRLDKVDADGMDIYLASTTAFIKFKDGHFDATPLHYWSIDRSIAPTHSGSIDRDGNYHAGARGLFKLRPDGTCEELSFFKGKHISSTTSDKNGDIWVACSWASPFCLYKITPTDTLAYTERDGCPPLGEEDIFQMAVDKHNRLWIASSKGLHCFDGTSWQTFDKSNSGLTTDRVYCIAFDREGRLWTSCGKQLDDYLELGDGLFCYDGKTWIHYVSSHDVRRVSEWWVGLTIPIPTNSIGRIHIDDNGMFWIACNVNEVYSTTDIDDWHGGLIRWDGKNSWQRFMSRNAATPDSIASDLPGNWVNSIETDKYGRVWLGFEGDHGIAMYDGQGFTVWDMDVPGIASGNITNMCIDHKRDRIWSSHSIVHGAVSSAAMRGSSTDIRFPSAPHHQADGKIYNLQGVQISRPTPGEVYIKDGRKIIAKKHESIK